MVISKCRINMRLSEEEFLDATARAKELGISSTALIRLLLRLPIEVDLGLAQSFAKKSDNRTTYKQASEIQNLQLDSTIKNADSEVITFTNKDIKLLKAELVREGNNLNQTTRALNRLNKFISQCVLLDSEEKKKMIGTVDEIYAEASKLTDDIKLVMDKVDEIIEKPNTAILVGPNKIRLKTKSKRK